MLVSPNSNQPRSLLRNEITSGPGVNQVNQYRDGAVTLDRHIVRKGD